MAMAAEAKTLATQRLQKRMADRVAERSEEQLQADSHNLASLLSGTSTEERAACWRALSQDSKKLAMKAVASKAGSVASSGGPGGATIAADIGILVDIAPASTPVEAGAPESPSSEDAVRGGSGLGEGEGLLAFERDLLADQPQGQDPLADQSL